MSMYYKSEHCIVIDHCQYISNLYQSVSVDDDINRAKQSFTLLPKIFSIKSTKFKDKKRKRKANCDVFLKEVEMIQQKYNKLMEDVPVEIKSNIFNKYNIMETSAVRDLATKLFETTIFDMTGICGGNNSDIPLKCKVKNDYILVPPKSRFYCGCVKEQCKKLNGDKFDILIADPPWWNKYIRRLKGVNEKLSYSMMYNEDIADISIKNLLSKNCLIAVWCTNAPSNITAIKDHIFPKWGVEYLTTWYWLKLTIDLEPMCEFGMGCQKQPYERVMIGKVGDVGDVPHNLLFASVPSALHSHKPPLLDLLKPHVNCENPQTLELFARYLLSNTTSVGYEPVKWQHISLYEEVA